VASGLQRGAGGNLVSSFGERRDYLYATSRRELCGAPKQFNDLEYSLHQNTICHLQPVTAMAGNANGETRRLVSRFASCGRFRLRPFPL
jgi:hypothetical protein